MFSLAPRPRETAGYMLDCDWFATLRAFLLVSRKLPGLLLDSWALPTPMTLHDEASQRFSFCLGHLMAHCANTFFWASFPVASALPPTKRLRRSGGC